jgi:DHA2 family multidrug resistance protein
MAKRLVQQSQLLTNRALFMLFAIISLVLVLLIVTVPAMYQTILHWKQRLAMRSGRLAGISQQSESA